MKLKKLKCNKTFSMKINLTMRSILKYSIYSICSIFLLSFIHCTNVDDLSSLFKPPIEGESNEPLTNITDHVFQRNSNGITLAWTSPTDTDFSKFLILKNTSPISDSPTTGHDYAGIDLIGSSQMMYNAAAPTFTDTDITAGITYFYKIFAYDVSFNYASGVQLKVDTLAPKVDTLAPSVTIPTSSLIVVEGVAQRYVISLATNALPPSGENVVINLSTNNALLTVNPSQLTLDSSNPLKIVTVTRVNNEIDESDNLMGMISHNLDSSTGASYNIDSVRDAVERSNITVFMSDDDMAGFIFTPAEVSVTEGMQEDYTVKLSSKPTGDVTLNVNPATGLSGDVASLTFTPLNWNAAQRVTITADDNNYVGGYTAQVNHGVSSADSKYSSITPSQITVNVRDNDGTGTIVISPNILAFDDVDGATGATYTLSLSYDPAPGKTVRVSLSSGSSALEVSPTVVNFGGATGIGSKTIIVRRAGGASGMIAADVTATISHTIATGGDYDLNIRIFTTSGRAINGGIVDVTINHTVPEVDSDHDGLIEIKDETMFDNMRHDLAGASYKTSAMQMMGDSNGCPASGCNGYELTADIDLESLLDTGGDDGIDTTMVGIDKNADGDTTDAGEQVDVIDIGMGKDKSWVPINGFTGTFEGNNHTIANLWVNISSSSGEAYAGLFGSTSGTTAEIRNVGVTSGSIHSSSSSSSYYSDGSYSGGLVGSGTVTITNSYFSGSGGVSSSSAEDSYSGGLVGSGTVTITNSYFSGLGGVSSSSADDDSYSGGLVGSGTVTITNSYFSGLGGVSSSASASNSGSYSGGLVGYASTVTITNSYFSGLGGVSSSADGSSSGGLVGYCGYSASITSTIVNSYFTGAGGVSDSSPSLDSSSGGLVGHSDGSLTIVNSYFSGSGGVSSSAAEDSSSGGLVGGGSGSSTIINSYFTGAGGVSSSSSSLLSYSGGLVGDGFTVIITNSYFSGSGGVSSSSPEGSYSGGLVGSGTVTITNSYFSGSGGVFSSGDSFKSFSGGLIGAFSTRRPLTVTNGYWNTDAPQSAKGSPQSPKRAAGSSTMNPSSAIGLTLTQLKAITMSTRSAPSPSGLPHDTTPNDMTDDNTKAWDLGTNMQLPAIKLCVPTVDTSITPHTIDWTTCASYGALLAGQRP